MGWPRSGLKFLGNVDLFGYKTTGISNAPELSGRPLSFEGKGFATRARLTSTFKIDKHSAFSYKDFTEEVKKLKTKPEMICMR